MAISVDWVTGVVTVPKADTVLVQASPEVRQYSAFDLHRDLRTLQASEGQPYPDSHDHITGPVLSGVTYADVVEILNPYTVEFEDGQYAVIVDGANHNIADVKVANQVSIVTNNSAGLIEGGGSGGGWDALISDYLNPGSFGLSQAIQEYDGRIVIDVINGAAGTTYPLGTSMNPVDNWADAVVLAGTFRAGTFELRSALTLSSGVSRKRFLGTSESAVLDVNGQALTDCEIERCYVTGDFSLSSNARLIECRLDQVSDVMGIAYNCITLSWVSMSGVMRFIDCESGVPGSGQPYYDLQGIAGATVSFRGYNGSVDLRGLGNANNAASIDINGNVTIAADCVDGEVAIRGIGKLNDNSGVGCTVDDDAFLSKPALAAYLLATEVNC